MNKSNNNNNNNNNNTNNNGLEIWQTTTKKEVSNC